MLNLEVLVEQYIGIIFMIFGLLILSSPKKWMKRIDDFSTDPNLDYYGFIAIYIGCAIVLLHNVWALDRRLITTIVGWLAIIKGVLLLNAPKCLFWFSHKFVNRPLLVKRWGLLLLVIAAIVLWSPHL